MLNPIEADILRTLFRSTGSLEFATLFFRIKRPSTDLAKAILSLKNKRFVMLEGNDVALTNVGLDYLNENHKLIFSSKPWREIPEEMVGENLRPNEPYIPKIPNIGKGVAFLK